MVSDEAAAVNMTYSPLSSLTEMIRQRYTFMILHLSYLSIMKDAIASPVLFIQTIGGK